MINIEKNFLNGILLQQTMKTFVSIFLWKYLKSNTFDILLRNKTTKLTLLKIVFYWDEYNKIVIYNQYT